MSETHILPFSGQTGKETAGTLLLVSHNFPPLQGAESLLVRHNTIDLHSRGWTVGVVTSPERHGRSKMDQMLLDQIPSDIQVMRTEKAGTLTHQGMGKIFRFFLGYLETQLLPCPSLLWKNQAVHLGQQWLKDKAPTVIYSRAPRHVSSLAAREIKLRTGLPWVAHFSDPWFDFSYDGYIHRRWIRFLEKRVIRDADAIVFPNAPLADKVMEKYPSAWKAKTHVIPHGFASLQTESTSPARIPGASPLRVLHTGAFYPVYRTPDSLFEGLALLNQRLPLKGRLMFDCVGDETTCFKPLVDRLGLQDVVKLKEAVPYARCQELITQADLLVVVDVTFGLRGVFLPTKLIEYFAFLKPVLGIAPPNSAVAQTLKGCGLECPNQDDPKDIADAFERKITAWESGHFAVSQHTQQQMKSYQISEVNDSLHKLLTSLLAAHP